MSIQSLTTTTLEALDRYQQAGRELTTAYNAGAARLVKALAQSYAERVQGADAPLFDDALKSRLIEAQQQISQEVIKSLQANNDRAVELSTRLADEIKSGIERLAAATSDSAQAAQARDSFALLQMPSAQLMLSAANAALESAKRLSEQVSQQFASAADTTVSQTSAEATEKRAKRA